MPRHAWARALSLLVFLFVASCGEDEPTGPSFGTLSVTTNTLAPGVRGAAYSATLAATGGDGTVTWAVTTGSLPTGLSLSTTTGVISGMPDAAGAEDFTVGVTSGDGQSATKALSLTVGQPLLSVTSASLENGIKGKDYTASVAATGGDGTYSWALASTSGPLPAGLDLAPDGALTGVPSAAGTSDFSVEATSGDGQTAAEAFSITVDAPPALLPTELCTDFPAYAVATFADAAFEGAVRSALGAGAGDDLTCAAVTALTVTRLTASNLGITSLDGAQNLTSIRGLDVAQNQITDLGPLSGLTGLTRLYFSYNQVSDIGPIAGMTDMSLLQFLNNQVSDISAVSGMTSLFSFLVSGNPISDLSPLTGLTSVGQLYLSGRQLTDIGPLATLSGLRNLEIRTTSVTDLSPLTGLAGIVTVDLLASSLVTDIQPLIDNTNLGAGSSVDLRGTAVSCGDVALLVAEGGTVTSDCP